MRNKIRYLGFYSFHWVDNPVDVLWVSKDVTP